MLRSLQLFILIGLFFSCSNPTVVNDQPDEAQPEEPHVSPPTQASTIVGKWFAIHLQQKNPSGEVCSQRSYQVEIDSTGVVYHITNDTLSRGRMGWIDPEEGDIRAFKTGDDLTEFRFRKYSEDQFQLERNLNHPPDQDHKQEPMSDPVTYPDGSEKPEPIRCDTEVWKFQRMSEE